MVLMDPFFVLDSHPVVYFIRMVCAWEMHMFPHQFLIVWRKAAKAIEWRKPGKLVPKFFPEYGCFFFH